MKKNKTSIVIEPEVYKLLQTHQAKYTPGMSINGVYCDGKHLVSTNGRSMVIVDISKTVLKSFKGKIFKFPKTKPNKLMLILSVVSNKYELSYGSTYEKLETIDRPYPNWKSLFYQNYKENNPVDNKVRLNFIFLPKKWNGTIYLGENNTKPIVIDRMHLKDVEYPELKMVVMPMKIE